MSVNNDRQGEAYQGHLKMKLDSSEETVGREAKFSVFHTTVCEQEDSY